ncbi:MAG: lamin tail domain-containing protein [Candidatus Eisenbacteria sp.]|nr:lamin tail domain-containing protein [Candidatus Eisenbacteria bacterium]
MGRTLVLVIACLLAAPAAAEAALCLNEIMADPATDWDGDGVYDYREDEWVELYNSGPGHINLGEYALSDDGGLWTYGFEDGDALRVGEALAIYGSQSLMWQSENSHPRYGFQMSNDGDAVVLWQIAGGDTVLVDVHTFNTYEADDDRSTGRNPDGIGMWEIYDGLNPYGGTQPPFGNDLAPTPGLPNSGDPPPVPIDEDSWGGVKGVFR